MAVVASIEELAHRTRVLRPGERVFVSDRTMRVVLQAPEIANDIVIEKLSPHLVDHDGEFSVLRTSGDDGIVICRER